MKNGYIKNGEEDHRCHQEQGNQRLLHEVIFLLYGKILMCNPLCYVMFQQHFIVTLFLVFDLPGSYASSDNLPSFPGLESEDL